MFFSVTFYLALAVFIIGVVYRVFTWFKIRIGPEATSFSVWGRIAAMLKGLITTLFSLRVFVLLKVFVLDILLQVQILREDFLRWVMHICIFYGFVFLLLMHALDEQITQVLFPDYASTLNPFMFLRNIFGAMAVLGLAIAAYRRFTIKNLRLITKTADLYAIIILVVIMISGFLLEGVKIVSSSVFDQMVEDYADPDETEEIRLLKLYWAKEFGVVFPALSDSLDSDEIEQGREVHEASCMDCHTRPHWAFVSYPIAKAITPIARSIDEAQADLWLWYIHFLACFFGLAYLPFSKFFHIISSPVSLLVNGVSDQNSAYPANTVTRRALALDACVHCGSCTLRCSVAPVFSKMLNMNILPSEKLISIKKTLVKGKQFGPELLQTIQEGSFICTGCYRCTEVCPVGINLQDLWLASKEDLAKKGFPELNMWARKSCEAEYGFKIKDLETPLTPDGALARKHMKLTSQADTFSACFECQTCTNVCPVVANYENPGEALDLTPHQIMHSLGLGLRDMALGSRMIWDCTTCYLCQEHCPQGVHVTDVFYELKNLAYEQLRTVKHQGSRGQDAEQASAGKTEEITS